MTQPRVFDGFCKAGGAGEGYRQAGFSVHGMDIAPQPRNPHEFQQGDVMELLFLASRPDIEPGAAALGYLRSFDLLHFSPPCQGYSDMRHAPNAKGAAGHPRLIGEIRKLVKPLGVPFVIENVEAAKWDMEDPTCLCGSMFDLRWDAGDGFWGWLKRHRLFETSWELPKLRCEHPKGVPCIGVYGGHARIRSALHGGREKREGWLGSATHTEVCSAVLGIDWMNLDELSEAIPPAYTHHIGMHFRQTQLRA